MEKEKVAPQVTIPLPECAIRWWKTCKTGLLSPPEACFG
jgi:hypothetical protein